MRKKLIFAVLFIFGSVLLFESRAQSNNPPLQVQLPTPAVWTPDLEDDMDPEIEGESHYYFSDTTNIDLEVIRIDDDNLDDSLKQRGPDQFVQDILEGKNIANNAFNASPTVMLNYSLMQDKDGHQILEIHCSQDYEDGKVETLERYYIYDNFAAHAQLRWRLAADPEKVKEAKKQFAALRINTLPDVR